MHNLTFKNYHPTRLHKKLYTYIFKLYKDKQLMVDQNKIMKEFVLIDSIIIFPTYQEQLESSKELYERKQDPTNNNNRSIMVQIKSIIIDRNSCQYRRLTFIILRMFYKQQSLILTFIETVVQSLNNIFFNRGIQIRIKPIKITLKKLRAGMIYTNSSRIDADQNHHNFSSEFQADNLKLNNKKHNVLLVMVGQNYFEEVRLAYNNITKHTQYNWFSDTRLKIQKEEQMELQSLVFSEHKNTEIQFIYFFLPDQNKHVSFNKTCKQMSLDLRISNQIVLRSTFEKKCQISFYKMLIQVSSKIGHIPWMIEIIPKDFQENTLVCDIKYLRTKQDGWYFSIVSSINHTQYHSQIKLIGQTKVLQDSFLNSLRTHSKFCDQKKLKNIIMLLAKGKKQNNVMTLEMRSIIYYNKFSQLELEQHLFFAFYIFQNQQNINLEHGSVISDSKLCQDNQFYLQSKELSTQLSSNPTSYKVYDFKTPNELANQNLFDQIVNISFYSQIQHLTYQLCWFYFSFTGLIKIPPPLKYALMLCNFYQKNDFKIPLVINQLEEKNYLYYI